MLNADNKKDVALYSLCRDEKSASFVKKQALEYGFTNINCILGLDYYQFLNKVILECTNNFALVCHNDVFFKKDFLKKIEEAINVVNYEIGDKNWAAIGNAGIEMVTHEIVRCIHDPYALSNEDMFKNPRPLIAADGNTLLINIANMQAKKVHLPKDLKGFHMYDVVLLMECYKKSLACVSHANLFVYHNSAGDHPKFIEFLKGREIINYLGSNFNDEVFYTMMGPISIKDYDLCSTKRGVNNFEEMVFNLFKKIYKNRGQLIGKVYEKLNEEIKQGLSNSVRNNLLIKQKELEIEQKEEEIGKEDYNIQQKDQEINFMKSSKFWKLREKYIKLKKYFW